MFITCCFVFIPFNLVLFFIFFFFQAEDGIRDADVTGVQTCALPIFFGLGAYVSAWTVGVAPWPVVIAGGALVAAAFAGLAGLAILHLRGTYFAVLTFGMSELTRHAVTYGEQQYAGTVGRVLTGVPSNRTVYFTVLVIAVAVRGSRFGLALIGIGADEQRAQTLGVPTRWVKVAGFALSAAFAGAAGAAMAVRWTYID